MKALNYGVKDFTSGNLFSSIFLYSVPLIFSNLLQVMFNVADVAVVGRFAGAMALGSVGSTTQLIFMFTGMIMGLGGGINVIVAYFIGSNNEKDLEYSVQTGLLISFIFGMILLAGGYFIARPVMVLIKTKPELMEGAVVYFKIYMLGMPGVALFNYGTAVLSAAGDTKRPLYYLTFSGIINIILNLFFVIVCKMSCGGVALASIISQYVSAVLVMIPLYKGLGKIKLGLTGIKVNYAIAVKIFKIGVPAGLQNSIFALANTFIQIGVNSFDAVMVAGVAAASNLDPIVYNAMGAFYTACATFIGQNYGANQKGRIYKSCIISNVYAFTVGAIFTVIYLFFGTQCLSLFTSDESVIQAGLLRLNIMAFSYPFATFMDNTIAANRGLGKTFMPSVIVLIGSCLFRILWIYTVFAWFKTIPSLFLLYIFSWIITAIAEIIYFVYSCRKVLK